MSVELNAARQLTDSYVAQQSQTINNFLGLAHEFQIADLVSYFNRDNSPPIPKPSLAISRAMWSEKHWVKQQTLRSAQCQDYDVIIVPAIAATPNGYIGYIIDSPAAIYTQSLLKANPQATKICTLFHCQMLSSCTMNYIWFGPVDIVITESGVYRWKI